MTKMRRSPFLVLVSVWNVSFVAVGSNSWLVIDQIELKQVNFTIAYMVAFFSRLTNALLIKRSPSIVHMKNYHHDGV